MSNFLKSIEGHTPGPWSVEKPSVNTPRFSIYSGTEVKPTWLADVYTARNRDSQNAHLFAKSYLLPDIYKLLETAVENAGQLNMGKAKQLLDKLNS